MAYDVILSTLTLWMVKSGFAIILTIIVSLIVLKLSNTLIDKYFNRLISIKDDGELKKRVDTLQYTVKSLVNIVVSAIGITIILAKLGINIGPILAAAGVLGIAVGFGAQRFIEDIITGFIILIEDQIRVGDVVEIAGKSGYVEKVDLKMVVLRDLSGNVHYVRNGKIDTITNMTKDFSFYVFDVGIAYRENVDRAIEIMKHVDEELRQDERFKTDILEPLEILGLDKFADSAMIIKSRVKTKPIRQWAVGREFNYRLKKKFDEHGIEIPFPHRTIYVKKEQENADSL